MGERLPRALIKKIEETAGLTADAADLEPPTITQDTTLQRSLSAEQKLIAKETGAAITPAHGSRAFLRFVNDISEREF